MLGHYTSRMRVTLSLVQLKYSFDKVAFTVFTMPYNLFFITLLLNSGYAISVNLQTLFINNSLVMSRRECRIHAINTSNLFY
jgi:hypothetical protein